MKLVNCTSHDIDIIFDGVKFIIPVSEFSARVSVDQVKLGVVEGIPIFRTVSNTVKGLPDPTPGVVFITSAFVAQIVKRPDVVTPNTAPKAVVRDAYGRVVATRSLLTYVDNPLVDIVQLKLEEVDTYEVCND